MVENQDYSIIPFAFGDNLVRAYLDEGVNPWWVAKDVCAILDLGNPRSSLALLDEDEKGVHSMDTPGGPQEMSVVNEPGLYSLIFRSRKPEAREFKRWVTHEVLPALRKTGVYVKPGSIDISSLNPEGMPEDVQRIQPRIRERCLDLALQTCRLVGISDSETLMATFVNYCRVIGGPSWNPDVPPHDERGRMLDEYIRACLVSAPGNRLSVENLYRHFKKWWAENYPRCPIPWKTALGAAVKRFYRPYKSYRWYYLDVDIAPEN